MPDDVLFSLNKAKDLNAINIVEHLSGQENDTPFQSGKVQVNGKFYDIQFVNHNGKTYLDVKRDFRGFFSFFRNRWGNKHTNCANELKGTIQNILASKKYVLVKNNYNALLDIGRKSNMESLEIGNYGFSDNRNVLVAQDVISAVNRKLQSEGKNTHLEFNKIDSYNTAIGITTGSLNMTTYNKVISNLSASQLSVKEDDCKKLHLDQTKAKAWIKFIQQPENAAKINIVKKLHSYMHQDPNEPLDGKQTGWKADFKKNPDQALRNFVIKNSPLPLNTLDAEFLDRAVNTLREFIELSNMEHGDEKIKAAKDFFDKNRWLTEADNKEIDKKLNAFMTENDCNLNTALHALYNGDRRNHNKLYLFVNNLLMYSTFRQTSKLGIDFFRQNHIPILFQHADRKHMDLSRNNKMDAILTENFWKDGNENVDSKGSEITNSEIRHAKQLDDKFGQESGIFYVAGAKDNPAYQATYVEDNAAPAHIGNNKDAFIEIKPSKYA